MQGAVNHLTDVQQSKLKGKGGFFISTRVMKEKIPLQLLKSKGFSPKNNMLSTLEVL